MRNRVTKMVGVIAAAVLVVGCEGLTFQDEPQDEPQDDREVVDEQTEPSASSEQAETPPKPEEPVVSEEPAVVPATEPKAEPPAKSLVLVPAGATLRVRTNTLVDSSSVVAGYRITATLQNDVMVAESVVLPKGTLVYARLVRVKVDGAPTLALKLTDVLSLGHLRPMETTDLAVVVEKVEESSIKMPGPKLDISSGSDADAAASVKLSGATVLVPAGTLLEFRLAKSLGALSSGAQRTFRSSKCVRASAFVQRPILPASANVVSRTSRYCSPS